MVNRRRRGGLLGRLAGPRGVGPAVSPAPPAPAPEPTEPPRGPADGWLPQAAAATSHEPTPEPSDTEPTPELSDTEPTPELSDTGPTPEPSDTEPTPEPGADEPAPIAPDPPAWVVPDPAAARWITESQHPMPEATSAWSVADEAPDDAGASRWITAGTGVIGRPERRPDSSAARWLPDDGADATARRRAQAVRTYCRELCGPEKVAPTVSRILATAGAGSDAELLRTARRIVAEQQERCSAAPADAAGQSTDELDPSQRRAFEAHLTSCLSCEAAELRSARAERAFTTALAGLDAEDAGPIVAPEDPAGRRGSGRGAKRRRMLGGAAAVLVAIAVAAGALLLHGRSTTSAALPAAHLKVTSSTHSASTRLRHARAKQRHPAHHRAARKPAVAAAARKPAASAGAASAGAGGAGAGGPRVSAALAPSAPVSSPAPPSSSSSVAPSGSGSGGSGGSGSGSVSAVQQSSSLPAQGAPTQGIGSGGSSGSTH